jgi:hypothetical protein
VIKKIIAAVNHRNIYIFFFFEHLSKFFSLSLSLTPASYLSQSFFFSFNMNFIALTTLHIFSLILSLGSCQFYFDFDVNDDDDDDELDELFKVDNSVDNSAISKIQMNSHDHERDNEFLLRAWNVIIETITETFDIGDLFEAEMDILSETIESLSIELANYMSESSDERQRRLKFYDINIFNNVTQDELLEVFESINRRTEAE